MKQQYKKFPYFRQGELLTSESLNNSFLYNDEQVRLSRVHLAGCGIMKGLNFRISKESLVLFPGEAIMPDGTLVVVENCIYFTQAVVIGNENDGNYRLFQDSEKVEKKVKFPSDYKNYTVVLTADHANENKSHCTGLSCDATTSKQLSLHIELRKSKQTETRTCEIKPTPDFVHLKPLNKGSLLNINLIYKRHRKLFNTNLSQVALGLLTLCWIMNHGFCRQNKVLVPMRCWRNLFDNAQEVSKALHAAHKRYSTGWHDSMTVYPIYYFQHLEYMAEAINECIAFYNDFAMRYAMIPIHEITHENALYLGLADNSPNQQNRYRSTFCRNNQDDMRFEAHKLERLLNRVIMMRKCFRGSNKLKYGDMKLGWDNPHMPLGERPIPYFYRKNEGLERYWPGTKAYSQNSSYDYWTARNTPDCLNNGDARLILQGCYRRNVKDIVKMLEKYIKENELDIKIELVGLVKKTLRHTNENHPKSNYAARLFEKIANETYREKMVQAGKDSKFNNIIKRIPKTIAVYIKNASENIEMPMDEVKLICNVLETINRRDYVDYLKIADPNNTDNNTYDPMNGKRMNSDVFALLALRSYYKMSYSDRNNIEYMHGCKDGGKLILFHHKNTFLFEGTEK